MKKELWLRLRAYQFANLVPPDLWNKVAEAFGGGDASTRAFASKIARKHGWTTSFALRAIAEYRKFVFLGVTGDVVVTPSKVIDTVWHEHVLFTKAYREFCRDVLQRDFDHHPELLATESQTALFAQQYDATLERYEVEFRVPPPVAIWGTPKFPREASAARRPQPATATDGGDVPLYAHFDGLGGTPGHHDMPEFGGGGFSGGGGGDDWGNEGAGGDGGGDSGGDGGGSGCSSGCGGGD
ncbi:glycine-rich domain-containing protein [Gemmatimonas phototrophica]|uniref:glycine-rich domain-containing protein n=1 Tax=Gemmatimonas phototrophica TaxID=1379270 RepID=UPI0006A6F3B1|nr:hypothetical protein [Gemmatimonas phototrophica]